MGQGVLTVAGFAIGSFFGAPQLGFVLGSLAGQAIFPTKLPGITGPRLSDTRTTTSQVGGAVMEVLGTEAVPGTVMWLGPLREVSNTEEVGGKGGGGQEQTTFTYSQSIAIGLCRGPMAGLQRIYQNGKLVYDIRPQQDYETVEQFNARVQQTTAYGDTFVLYLGTESQLPDPTIQADKGVDDTPPMRGLMYIVYPDRQLQQDQALRHPNFKFEVFREGVVTDQFEYAQEVVYPWTDGLSPINSENLHTAIVGGTGELVPETYDATEYDSIGGALASLTSIRGLGMNYMSYSLGATAPFGLDECYTVAMGSPDVGDFDVSKLRLQYNPVIPSSGSVVRTADDIDVQLQALIGENTGNSVLLNVAVGLTSRGTLFLAGDFPNPPIDPVPAPYQQYHSGGGAFLWGACANGVVEAWRRPSPPLGDGWELDESTTYRALQVYSVAPYLMNYPLGPIRPVGHAEYDDTTFWTTAYDAAVLSGDLPSGWTYGLQYPGSQDYGYLRQVVLAEGSPVSIASAITAICGRVGITDIDVSDLEDRFVRGYVISRVMNARDAIEPLRLVGYFDIVDSGCVLKFPTRGNAAVRTLEDTDIGAYEADGEAPAAVTTRKAQDVELPRQIRFHYRAPSRDYEEGEQLSPSRVSTLAVNDVDVECAVALDDDHAAQAAEISWADAWAGRWAHSTTVDQSQLDLEAADVLLIPIDSRLERVRIVAIDDKVSLLRTLELVRDDDGSYVSRAIAAVPQRPPAQVAVYAPTDLELFDLPPLRLEDNDAGIYAAASPTTTGSWTGVQIFRSIDDGTTFQAVASITNAATFGEVDEALPAGVAAGTDDEFDDVNVLTVVLASGTFSSRPDDEVIEDGANNIAIGIDGRWEIVGFGTATQVGDVTWELSHLLRGRRGTEHNIDLSEAGDRAILVSGQGVIRLPLQVADIGEAYIYKAVTIGASFTTGVDQTYASGGEALVPFSPIDIVGQGMSDDDLLISWTRRDRLGQELAPIGPTPMSEASEEWDIEILSDESSPEVLRTLSSNVSEVVYSEAHQMIDFGSSAPPEMVLVRVYQISEVMGRGTPKEEYIFRDPVS